MNYKDLKVWQKADELALEVDRISRCFPKDELFGLTAQIRRAALSIPTNIVEGYARKGDKELARFLNISIGSFAEVEYLMEFSRKIGYLDEQSFTRISLLMAEVGKLLWQFYRKVSGQ